MSVQASSAVWALRDVTPSEKLVLLALANYAAQDGRCWPSQDTLADDTGLTDRTVRTVCQALEAKGLISREQRRRDDGYRTTDLVVLLFFASPETASAKNLTGNPRRSHRKSTAVSPEAVSPPTTFEPSENHQGTSLTSFESARAKPATRTVDRRKTRRCPPNYEPSEAVLSVGRSVGLSDTDICFELDKMRDHQFRDGHVDWDAVFRNWLRNAKPQRRGAGAQQLSFAAQDMLIEEAGMRLAREQINARRNGDPGRNQGTVVALPGPETRAEGSRALAR